MGTGSTNGFDDWLESELRQSASRETAPNPLPSQSRYQTGPLQGNALNRLSFALAAIVPIKAVTVLALTVAAIVAAGATTEAVITGSPNPADWGHQVVQQVHGCKVALAPGGHGIGQCVSSFASQHGQHVSKTPGTSSPGQHPKGGPPSSHPSPGKAAGKSNDGGSDNGHVGKP
jgi:hypothetical protein